MNILVVDDEIYARKALIKQVTELLGSRPCELSAKVAHGASVRCSRCSCCSRIVIRHAPP